jgi:hypothetical protein
MCGIVWLYFRGICPNCLRYKTHNDEYRFCGDPDAGLYDVDCEVTPTGPRFFRRFLRTVERTKRGDMLIPCADCVHILRDSGHKGMISEDGWEDYLRGFYILSEDAEDEDYMEDLDYMENQRVLELRWKEEGGSKEEVESIPSCRTSPRRAIARTLAKQQEVPSPPEQAHRPDGEQAGPLHLSSFDESRRPSSAMERSTPSERARSRSLKGLRDFRQRMASRSRDPKGKRPVSLQLLTRNQPGCDHSDGSRTRAAEDTIEEGQVIAQC